MNTGVKIDDGNLSGKGVYATKDFEKDEVVVKYSLTTLSEDVYQQLPEHEKQFTHIHKGQIYLYSEPERYINHSDTPNTYQDLEVGADRALRCIQAGEMITTDSSKDDI